MAMSSIMLQQRNDMTMEEASSGARKNVAAGRSASGAYRLRLSSCQARLPLL
jgi:hypothetical protein